MLPCGLSLATTFRWFFPGCGVFGIGAKHEYFEFSFALICFILYFYSAIYSAVFFGARLNLLVTNLPTVMVPLMGASTVALLILYVTSSAVCCGKSDSGSLSSAARRCASLIAKYSCSSGSV